MEKKEKRALAAGAAVLGGAALIRSEYEKVTPTVRSYTMTTARVEKITRLIFLSDLHGNSFGNLNEEMVEIIKKLKPDAILIGGDMMVTKPHKEMDFSALDRVLSEVYGTAPVYYGEGNHELRMKRETEIYPGWWEEFNSLLEAYDVKYLLDETVKIDDNVYLSGLEIEHDLYSKLHPMKMPAGYLHEHLKDMPPETAVHVVMAHTPKYMENYWAEGADLVLSGHYHGGVVGLPRFKSLISPEFTPFPKYARGIYTDGKGHGGIVSAGLGTHTINVRLFNKPELVILDIMPELPDGSMGQDGTFGVFLKNKTFCVVEKDGTIGKAGGV